MPIHFNLPLHLSCTRIVKLKTTMGDKDSKYMFFQTNCVNMFFASVKLVSRNYEIFIN